MTVAVEDRGTQWLRAGAWTAGLGLVYALMMLAPTLLDGYFLDTTTIAVSAVTSIVFGAATYGLFLAYRRFSSTFGKVTAIIALIAFMAVVGTGLALVLPTCPGSRTGDSCTPAGAAGWGISAALLVVIATGIVVGWKVAYATARKPVLMVRERLQDRARQKQEQVEAEELAAAKKASKHRAPHEPKGYPTPKQPKKRQKREF